MPRKIRQDLESGELRLDLAHSNFAVSERSVPVGMQLALRDAINVLRSNLPSIIQRADRRPLALASLLQALQIVSAETCPSPNVLRKFADERA